MHRPTTNLESFANFPHTVDEPEKYIAIRFFSAPINTAGYIQTNSIIVDVSANPTKI